MPVVHVREMRMRVGDRFVPVPMHMSGTRRDGLVMAVLVVLVAFAVGMFMAVLQCLVRVFVLVPLDKVEPDADCHQQCRNN
jgi:hypothetical protein